ncbi:MAG TPA: EutP/PduV family microcompartment system protein [Candidatus Merdenecus merdavium]|nr:EutP/PduV family microcompartment system protein [Candidatus Merdenecus merdavium]
MEKVIFIGKTSSGKTTLCQKLNEMDLKYKKTQSVEVYSNAIDTPGEYLENRRLYSGIIMSAVDAKVIALVADPTVEENYIPPSFASTFGKEIIGIITKMNLVDQKQNLDRARQVLKNAGVQRIFEVDTVDNVGIEELFQYLDKVLNENT